MSISALYIMDKKGNILINRNYKSEVYEQVVDKFLRKLMSMDPKEYSPFLIDEENEIVHVFQHHKNLICKLTSFDHRRLK